MVKRILLLAALLVVGLAGGVSSNVNATPNDPKVTICHRTNSVTNPYNELSVAQSAVDGVGNGDHYLKHQGPIATSTGVAQVLKDSKQKWGDIIPPVGAHSGLNWTTEGQSILANHCEVPNVAPDDIVVVTKKESLDCDTKKVTVTTTTTTTTYLFNEGNGDEDEGGWVAQEPVVSVEESTRDATTKELATCPDGGGEVLGTNTVKNLPYTGGDATAATVLSLSAIAGAVTIASVVGRTVLTRKI